MSGEGDVETESEPLREYRVYALDDRNRIFRPAHLVEAGSPAHLVEAGSDESAIEMATRLFDGCGIELWHGTRLVVRF